MKPRLIASSDWMPLLDRQHERPAVQGARLSARRSWCERLADFGDSGYFALLIGALLGPAAAIVVVLWTIWVFALGAP
jgi:hypothetical protein